MIIRIVFERDTRTRLVIPNLANEIKYDYGNEPNEWFKTIQNTKKNDMINTINKIKGNMLKSQQKNLLFEYDLDNDNTSIWDRRIKQNEDGTFIVVHESLYDEKGYTDPYNPENLTKQ